MKFINWLKPSFEDNHGRSSYRRITAFVFVCLISYMIIFDKVQQEVHLKAFYSMLVTLLLLIGIVTTQNILTFLNRKNDEK